MQIDHRLVGIALAEARDEVFIALRDNILRIVEFRRRIQMRSVLSGEDRSIVFGNGTRALGRPVVVIMHALCGALIDGIGPDWLPSVQGQLF